ncbi:hypothetical protein WJX72_001061 [[Myrmecia] bisecta]|uniref:peptide-methionine (S)-S-oxide reductase n=1 Tax=[Myrmecia] bisecta TaxID=41462 RepID=A0AAW1R491_9CHLO
MPAEHGIRGQATSTSGAGQPETATFALGCFWCPESKFSKLEGVVNTRVGYTGGSNLSPTYNTVCSNDGHTEAVKIEFDPHLISYERLLKEFFNEHDPSRQAGKAQYKSAVWTHSDAQATAVAQQIKQYEDRTGKKVATDVAPAGSWHDAEEYHQKYYEKAGRRGG